MSEEVKHASRNVPRAMVISVIVNGFLALGMLLAVLFCKVDIDKALESQYPFVPIFATALNSNVGATALTSVILILVMAASIGSLAASSRMIWAFSRDKGVPGWRFLSKVCSLRSIDSLD
jgi:choline transport protein